MKQKLFILLLSIFSGEIIAQTGSAEVNERIKYTVEQDDPEDVAKTIVALELFHMDGAIGNGALDFNLGLYARHELSNNLAAVGKIRKSYGRLTLGDTRKNFELELGGVYFMRHKQKTVDMDVILSESKSEYYIRTESFKAPATYRSSFGYNAGILFKTLGINPSDSEKYTGNIRKVNHTTLGLYGGVQFRRNFGTIFKIERYKRKRFFDSYLVTTFDGLFMPINTFTHHETGERLGAELREDGYKNMPFGGRFTMTWMSGLPTADTGKFLRKYLMVGMGVRPYAGFTFEFGAGLTLFTGK